MKRAIFAGVLLAAVSAFGLDPRTEYVALPPGQSGFQTVRHVSSTPLIIAVTVTNIEATGANMVTRDDEGTVVNTITNVSISGSVYTFTSTAGQWATNIFTDGTAVGEYETFFADVFLTDYGDSLPGIKFRVRYSANTGSEAYVDPLTGSWIAGGVTSTTVRVVDLGDGGSISGSTVTLDDGLQDIAGLTPADGAFVVGDGTDWVAETGAVARASMGAGTGDGDITGVTAGTGLTGGGASGAVTVTLSTNAVTNITAGANITVTDNGANVTIAASSSGDITSVTAGTGLTGGGASGDVTLTLTTDAVTNLTAGSGITLTGSGANITIASTGGTGTTNASGINANFASPTSYVPATVYVDAHLKGIDSVLTAHNVTGATHTASLAVLDPAQVVTVAKSGADYTTIQGAIDSITDNATGKRYVVLIYPGTYTENVTMEEYVSLVGLDHESTRITSASGTTLTAPPGTSDAGLYNLAILSTPTADGAICFVMTAGEIDAYDCYFKMTSTNNGVEGNIVAQSGGELEFNACAFKYNLDGSSAGAATHSTIGISGNSEYHLYACELDVDVDDVDDTIVGINEVAASTNEGVVKGCIMHLDANHAAYSGTAGMLYFHGAGVHKTMEDNHVGTYSAGNGTAYGAYMDTSAGGGEIHSTGNRIHVTGFANNYGANVAAGDTWVSHFDDVVAALGTTGAGTFTTVQSPADGVLFASTRVITAAYTNSGGGVEITEFSSDGTLAGDSDAALPTEKAVKTYADTMLPLAGGTMAGAINMGDNAITGIDYTQSPTNAALTDAASGTVRQYASGDNWYWIYHDGSTVTTNYLKLD